MTGVAMAAETDRASLRRRGRAGGGFPAALRRSRE